MIMKRHHRFYTILLFVSLFNFCFGQNEQPYPSEPSTFNQYINQFSPLTNQEPLLALQWIGYTGYHETLLDSIYYDFFNRTVNEGVGLYMCNAIPFSNEVFYATIPFFRPYATFRIDCPDGYLVCICHRFNSNTSDLSFLEFVSYDKQGVPLSKMFLPYMANISEGNNFLTASTLLYVSNSHISYSIRFSSNSCDHVDNREILYSISSQGKLCFKQEKKKQISGSDLIKRPSDYITIE